MAPTLSAPLPNGSFPAMMAATLAAPHPSNSSDPSSLVATAPMGRWERHSPPTMAHAVALSDTVSHPLITGEDTPIATLREACAVCARKHGGNGVAKKPVKPPTTLLASEITDGWHPDLLGAGAGWGCTAGLCIEGTPNQYCYCPPNGAWNCPERYDVCF